MNRNQQTPHNTDFHYTESSRLYIASRRNKCRKLWELFFFHCSGHWKVRYLSKWCRLVSYVAILLFQSKMAPVIFLRSSFLLLWHWIKQSSFATVEPVLRTTHYQISVDHIITFWNISLLYFILSYSRNIIIRGYSAIFILFYLIYEMNVVIKRKNIAAEYCCWRTSNTTTNGTTIVLQILLLLLGVVVAVLIILTVRS